MKGIYHGYKNALLRNDTATEKRAATRLKVCAICPNKRTAMGVNTCGLCGCPLAALTRQNQKVCNVWRKYGT